MRKFLLRLIAVSEMVGALAAFGMECESVVLTLRDTSNLSILAFALDAAFSFGLSVLTFLAGVALWRMRPAGLKLSMWAQATQIPQLVSSALTYKAELGLGLWLFCHTRSWVLGFTAGLLNIDTRLAFGSTGTPTIAINVLAAGFFIYLLRARRAYLRTGAVGEDEDSDDTPPRSRRALRFVTKSALVLLAVVATPVLAFWIYNRIDESATPQARHWFAPLPHSVPDAQNAWLYLLGLGAAANDDPLALGKRIVDAHDAREAQVPHRDPDDAEVALRKGELAYVAKGADGRSIANVCPAFTYTDCVQWAMDNGAELDELAQANATLLQRYATALDLPKFEEFSVPALQDPIPDVGDTVRLYAALILRDLAIPARRGAALDRLTHVAAFWRRVDAQANGEVGKLVAERFLDSCAQILDAAVNHWGAALLQDASYVQAMEQILAAPSAEQRDYEMPLRRNAVTFAHLMDASMMGAIDTWRYCEKSCLQSWLTAQAYLPQATANLQAQFFDLRLEAFAADPRAPDTVGERASSLVERNTVSNDAWRNIEFMSYNMAGKTLAIISMPAYAEFIHRRHDMEARRRLYRTKAEALRRHVAPAGMPAFLAAQPDEMRNPYTGEAFEWNADLDELRFAPKAKYWKRSYLAVAYADLAAPVVAACAEPVSLRVFVHAGAQDDAPTTDAAPDASAQQFDLVSCAAGVRNALPSLARSAGQSHAVPDVRTITVARHGGKLDLRVVLDVAKDDWRSFDAVDVPLQQRTAAVAVDGSDLQVEIEARPLRQSGLFFVDAHAVPARQLVAQFAKAGNIKPAGAGPETPVALQAEGMTAAALLERLTQTAQSGR